MSAKVFKSRIRKLTDSFQDAVIEGHLLGEITLDDGHADFLGWTDDTVASVRSLFRARLTTLLLIEVDQNTLLLELV